MARRRRPSRLQRPWRLGAAVAVCGAGLGLGAAAADTIELYYFERPPYMATRPGSDEPVGLTATPAAQAFRAAGIGVRWVPLPSARQLVTLADSKVPACAVGWFRTAEREQQFKFTRAIYRDRPTVALARTDFTPPAPTLAQALREPGLTVLVKAGFSYGAQVDTLLAQLGPGRVVTSADSLAMVQMVAAQRASVMFAAEEEAAYLVEQALGSPGALKIVHFSDLPPGERRHILCSKAVPDALIERLNKAIGPEPP